MHGVVAFFAVWLGAGVLAACLPLPGPAAQVEKALARPEVLAQLAEAVADRQACLDAGDAVCLNAYENVFEAFAATVRRAKPSRQ